VYRPSPDTVRCPRRNPQRHAAFAHLRITVITRNYVNLLNFCAQGDYRLCLTGNPALRILGEVNR
jgi:hypothetical protein